QQALKQPLPLLRERRRFFFGRVSHRSNLSAPFADDEPLREHTRPVFHRQASRQRELAALIHEGEQGGMPCHRNVNERWAWRAIQPHLDQTTVRPSSKSTRSLRRSRGLPKF